jgi:hypothetical protein
MTGLFRSSAAGRMGYEKVTLERVSHPGNSRLENRVSTRECAALSLASLGNCPGAGKSFV